LCGVSIFVGSWVLTLKIDTISAYWIIFHIVPGAGAIRAGDRVQLCVNLWVVSALILMIDRWVASSPTMSRNRRRFLAGAVLAFCVIEQVNLWSNGLARATELAELRAVPAPPRECRSFLVKYFGEVGEVDAMWISMKTGLPTLNGRSGGAPPGWRLSEPSVDYAAVARQWIAQNQLSQQVCIYDEVSRRWSFF
jgi:hypothetical protein